MILWPREYIGRQLAVCELEFVSCWSYNKSFCRRWLALYRCVYFYTQADICHAYQVLRRHGFPSNRIITMMFDDIADNTAWVQFVFWVMGVTSERHPIMSVCMYIYIYIYIICLGNISINSILSTCNQSPVR